MEPLTLPPFSMRSGEQLLWSGRPSQEFPVFQARDLFMVPFSIVWFGFMIFWNVGVWSTEAPLPFRLFGIPFLVVGSYFLVGRFVHNWLVRRSTTYFLTNQRAAVVTGLGTPAVRQRELRGHRGVETKVAADGSGTIRFDQEERFPLWSRNANPWYDAGLTGVQFFRIDDAGRVTQLLDSIQWANTGQTTPFQPGPWSDRQSD